MDIQISRICYQKNKRSRGTNDVLYTDRAAIRQVKSKKKVSNGMEFLGSKQKTSDLLFMDGLKFYSFNKKELDSLVQTTHIFSKDIEMEFGIEKCAMLVREKGKFMKSVGN